MTFKKMLKLFEIKTLEKSYERSNSLNDAIESINQETVTEHKCGDLIGWNSARLSWTTYIPQSFSWLSGEAW